MELYEGLSKPFKEKEIEWRVQSQGKKQDGTVWCMVLAYVDARACTRRLDQVVGPLGWKREITHLDNGVMCKLSLYDEAHNQWVGKDDGAEETKVEAFKGGISKAFVRACAAWGIGRYLYYLPSTFAEVSMERKDGWNKVWWKEEKITYWWKTPSLPAWALPKEE